jgi:type IV secretion system protein VirB5
MMKTSKKKVAAENPYLTARQTWNTHEGNILAAKRLWQAFCFLCLLIVLAAVGGIIHIGSQSKFIPYIVEVDKLGQTVAVARVDRVSSVDPRIIHASLAGFIFDARLVTPDQMLQRKAVFHLYALLAVNDAATAKMTEWLNGDPEANPFKRAEKEVISAEIVTVIPQSKETWQVDWRETVRDRQGALIARYNMRALLNIYFNPPDSNTTEEQVRSNPIGLFIRDFSWSRLSM